MPTTSTPSWQAVRNGLSVDPGATMNARGINQLLGAHASSEIYLGNSVVTPSGTGGTPWLYQTSTLDLDQPFTMSGTVIGRVALPLLPVGNGADLVVSLCADASGSPGTLINQTVLPASWINQLSFVEGVAGPSSLIPFYQYTGNPLATFASNSRLYSQWQSVPWSAPGTSATGGLGTAQMAQSDPYMIFAGGVNASNGNSTAIVSVITYTGGTTVSAPVPAPALPQPLLAGGFVVTSDSLCYVGGVNINGASSVVQSTVYTASWNPSTGAIGTWSVQTALPHTLVNPGMAAYTPTDTVYVVGGSTNYAPETNFTSNVYYSPVTNQQVTAWASAPSLPVAIIHPTVSVVGNWLIVAGGIFTSGLGNTAVYYAPINPVTGVPGGWGSAPSVPTDPYL